LRFYLVPSYHLASLSSIKDVLRELGVISTKFRFPSLRESHRQQFRKWVVGATVRIALWYSPIACGGVAHIFAGLFEGDNDLDLACDLSVEIAGTEDGPDREVLCDLVSTDPSPG
jgi:hypothetical protein